MFRQPSVLAVLVFAALTPRLVAQTWVDKMVEVQKHDFGTVARGSDTVFRFPIKNIYKQDIELVSVRSSCGCTSPSLENKLLKTGDVGYVVASFNTRTFTGVHGATLTLTAAWNDNQGTRRTGETQLRVDGNIRSDVVFQPGAINFENIEQGATSEQITQITYAGRPDWKIVDIRGDTEDLEIEMTERQRAAGRVAYDVLVRIKPTAAAGYFNQQLVLVTNDERNPRIPLHVSGRVVPGLSVAPETLLLGSVPRGDKVSKKLLVRGKEPFRILKIESDGEGFQFNVSDSPSDRHIVEVTFDARQSTGDVKQAIQITTDLDGSRQATVKAHATVVPAGVGTAGGGAGEADIRPNAASTGNAGAMRTAGTN
jgi:hypothetical protein